MELKLLESIRKKSKNEDDYYIKDDMIFVVSRGIFIGKKLPFKFPEKDMIMLAPDIYRTLINLPDEDIEVSVDYKDMKIYLRGNGVKSNLSFYMHNDRFYLEFYENVIKNKAQNKLPKNFYDCLSLAMLTTTKDAHTNSLTNIMIRKDKVFGVKKTIASMSSLSEDMLDFNIPIEYAPMLKSMKLTHYGIGSTSIYFSNKDYFLALPKVTIEDEPEIAHLFNTDDVQIKLPKTFMQVVKSTANTVKGEENARVTCKIKQNKMIIAVMGLSDVVEHALDLPIALTDRHFRMNTILIKLVAKYITKDAVLAINSKHMLFESSDYQIAVAIRKEKPWDSLN